MRHTPASAARDRARRAVRAATARLVSRLQAAQQEHRRLQFEATGTPDGRVVFLGDSISEGGLWDEWFPDQPVLNRGIGGETSAQVLARLDSAIAGPRAVFLLVGTNDLTTAVPEDDIVDNVEGILDEIERRAPWTPVHVQSVMPRTARFRDSVRSLNQRLERLVAGRPDHVHFLDLWPALADADGDLRREYSIDRLHLNGEGYRAWTEVLRPVLASLPARPAP